MAAGRKVKLYKGTGVGRTLVAGGREHGIAINNEMLDITDKDSNGWRTLDTDVGLRSIDVSFDGLFKTAAMLADSVDDDTTKLRGAYEIEIDGFGKFAGTFALVSINITGTHDDNTMLSGELQSSGEITWTAAT